MEHDYKKLRRCISYQNGNVYLPLLIVAKDNGTLNWNTDASFTVRPDCTSHTGACLILMNGSELSISAKQKINNKCLTSSELIGVGDAMIFITETEYFFKSQ